ncbi:putative transcription factor OFP family [Helianthus annuus]|uniref:Transcription repressor n=1 Tax=Helianthus annuus TaxID=4232 RepID=A0A251VMT5_HELAN|nr:transcription repressor OFP11 [Helianthus annuus]KAF5820530.1 putative transcription factor OFP family [Helianthus annuus]KAJ0610345.1 putative transcription factor OFP family [Helianthus annuus]KAJ0620999.1 putative transcription factor OFP family [Helianthus annuus]KAJ0625567.1 putative transcription factor OFP family [Helianthus annuus]KAJ0781963.1 putative transcription factor OFP family [Helianthus annuus]
MPTTFERNLNLCFTKLKRHQSPPPPPTHHRHHHRRRHSDPTVIKTFNTLYDASDSDHSPTTTEFPTVIASDRFFFSSPGRSNSIIESSSHSTSSIASTSFSPAEYSGGDGFESVGGGVAIPTISPDPYFDFRKSMQEMVEARDLIDVRANWDYLHELLTCYLELNPKSAHKFIVGAFADLLVTLMTAETGGGGDGRNM